MLMLVSTTFGAGKHDAGGVCEKAVKKARNL